MRLRVLAGRFAVCRLGAGAALPPWLSLADGAFGAVVRRGSEELSLVCSFDAPPADVPIFALATYDTDVVLVPGARADDAVAALRGAGHEVEAA